LGQFCRDPLWRAAKWSAYCSFPCPGPNSREEPRARPRFSDLSLTPHIHPETRRQSEARPALEKWGALSQPPLTSFFWRRLGSAEPGCGVWWRAAQQLQQCLQPRVVALPHPLLSPSQVLFRSRLIPLQTTWCAKGSNSGRMGLFMPVHSSGHCRCRRFRSSAQSVDPLERDQKRAKPSPLVLESDLPVRAFSGTGRRQLGCDP